MSLLSATTTLPRIGTVPDPPFYHYCRGTIFVYRFPRKGCHPHSTPATFENHPIHFPCIKGALRETHPTFGSTMFLRGLLLPWSRITRRQTRVILDHGVGRQAALRCPLRCPLHQSNYRDPRSRRVGISECLVGDDDSHAVEIRERAV